MRTIFRKNYFRNSHLLILALSCVAALFAQPATAENVVQTKMALKGETKVSSTGALVFTIPIETPPGTADIVPALSLQYSSRREDGIVGVGWDMVLDLPTVHAEQDSRALHRSDNNGGNSIPSTTAYDTATLQAFQQLDMGVASHGEMHDAFPAIVRCPRTMAQNAVHGGVNFNSNDRFCLGGRQLIVISGTYGANNSEYRTETEVFDKIVAHGTAGSGPAWFELHTRDGLSLEFGNTQDSKVPTVPVTGSIAPAAGTVRAWQINKASNSSGSYLTVTYNNGSQDLTNGQSYPTKISYTGNSATSLAPYNSVQFFYANRPATDIVPTYHAGTLQQTTVLLANIKTYQGTTLVSDYRLTYDPGNAGYDHDRLTGLSRCDVGGTCLAPMTFGWQGNTGLPPMNVLTDTYSVSHDTDGFIAGDYNDDGLTDVCLSNGTFLGTASGTSFTSSTYGPCTQIANLTVSGIDANSDNFGDKFHVNNGTISLFFNNKQGGWTQPDPSGQWFGATMSNTAVIGADFNGDGIPDVSVYPKASADWPTGIVVYYGTGSTAPAPNGPFVQGPHYSQGFRTNPSAADFDGDGCADILSQPADQSTHPNTLYYSCSPAAASITGPRTSPTGKHVILGDYNGDGKADIFFYGASLGGLYLSTGTGFVNTGFPIPSNWVTDYEFAAGDWNGDGKTDLALVPVPAAGSTVLVYLSTGTSFVQVGTVANITEAYAGGPAYTFVADWNSDGASDLWFSPNAGNKRCLFSYVPELMTSISNGIGATTTVAYDRINKNGTFYTLEASAVFPAQDVDGALYVVSQVNSPNGIGATYNRSYAYTGAKRDLNGRGFLGFSQIKSTDVATGLIETTMYRTDFPYIGEISQQTTTCPTLVCTSAITIRSNTNTLQSTTLGTGAASRYFVSFDQTVAAAIDLDGTTLPTTTTTFTYDCDSNPNPCYGNATTIAKSVSDGSSKTLTRTFANDTTNWILGEVLTQNVQGVVGTSNLTRHFSYTYFTTTGLLKQANIEPSTPSLKLQTDFTYDAFGNRTTATKSGQGILSRTISAGYDAKGEFITATSNELNQSEQWAYNAGFGIATSNVDLNSLTTSWSYDTFGRNTLVTPPDGTKLSTSYLYCSGVNGGTASCPTYGAYVVKVTPLASNGTTQNGPIKWTFYDTLNRVIAKDVQGFDGSTIRVASPYDAFGRIAQKSRPYFLVGGTAKWTVNQYDALDRLTKETFPDASDNTYSYHGLSSSITDDKNHTTTSVKNAQGLAASITDALNHTTTYVYDAFGDLTKITDPLGNQFINGYDLRGRKISSSDPDLGGWTYGYDVLDELTSQTDSQNQVSAFSYDKRRRLIQRAEPGLTSTWEYDTAAHGVGKIASATAGNGYSRVHSYDALSRPSQTQLTITGNLYAIVMAYDANGRVSTVTYPSGFIAQYGYTSLGYQNVLKDGMTSQVYWTVTARDAELHTLTQIAGNGVMTSQAFDPNTGLIQTTQAGASNGVANFAYSFDMVGNLTQRKDLNTSLVENVCYDALDRMTNYAVNPSGACNAGTIVKSVNYDWIGNVTSKSDVGSYSYPPAGQNRPHAVSNIASCTGCMVNGVSNPSFSYDLNGNMATGAARTFTYTSFNMPASIAQGASTLTYNYDTEHRRIEQAAPEGTTVYINDSSAGVAVERFTGGSASQWNDYLFADGRIVGVHFAFSDDTSALRYFIADHLGSIAILTDESGSVVEGDSYDAWGKRRFPNGMDDLTGSITSQTTRGFTSKEHIAGAGLINFDARVYDPTIGRFTSGDPVTATPYQLQTLNRYGYAMNNPLTQVDPDGLAACNSNTKGCIDDPKSESGDEEQPEPTAERRARDVNVVRAQERGRLDDSTKLHFNERTDNEDVFGVSNEGTYGLQMEQRCFMCGSKPAVGGRFPVEDLRDSDDPGHDHPRGLKGFVDPKPGPGDDAVVRDTKRTGYEISRRGAFAVERTAVGYRVRQLNGDPLTNAEIAQVRETIRAWNHNQGGGSCRVVACH